MKRLWSLDPRYYLIAATAFVSIFCLIPLSLYAHAGEDWNFPWYLLLIPAAIGLFLFIGTAIVIRLLAIRYARTAAVAAITLFCFGVFTLLAHVYTPIQIGPLDGSRIVSDEPLRHALLELAIFALLAIGFVQLIRGKGLTIATTFSLSLVILGLGYFLVNPLTGDSSVATTRDEIDQTSMPDGDAPAPTGGNVYHFVLDMMDTNAFLSTVERLGMEDEFAGFDLFKNNISNYTNTVPSSASYFTGTFYHTGDYEDWVRAWHKRGLLRSLAEQEYTIWMYAPYPDWNNGNVDKFWDVVGIYEQEMHVEHARFYDFVQIWLASVAPSFLANEALAAGDAIRERAFGLFIGDALLSGEEGLEPYASVLMLDRIDREEAARPAHGQYMYVHAILPHGPEVMDGRCNYVGAPPDERTRLQIKHAYLVHAECAVRLIVRFLRHLKELDRYDQATIVLHADTGHWTAFEPEHPLLTGPDGTTLEPPNRRLRPQVHSLLMIKRPRADDPLEVLETPTQLVDLYPTLLEILNIDPPSYPLHGRSVYAIDPDEPREARFGLDPNKHLGPDIIEIRIEDPRDLRHSDLTVIGPATDPALWRPELKN